MPKWTNIAVAAVLLATLSFGLAVADSLGAQDGSAGSREESAGRSSHGTRQQPGQNPDVDATVRMLPSTTGPLHVGERVSLEIEITSRREVGHTPFHVRFDPEVLRFDSAAEGQFLGSDGGQTTFISSASTNGDAVIVGLSRLGRGEGVEGDGRLCTLHFTAVGPGDARVEFARASVRDGANRVLASQFSPASIRVR